MGQYCQKNIKGGEFRKIYISSNLLHTINISNGGCKKKFIGCKRICDICASKVMKNFDNNQQEPKKQLISGGTKYFIKDKIQDDDKKQTVDKVL